jgi:hypothetical protein
MGFAEERGGGGDGRRDVMIVHLMDLALVTCLNEPFDVLIEERPPESLEELHTDGLDLLVT